MKYLKFIGYVFYQALALMLLPLSFFLTISYLKYLDKRERK